MVPNAVAFLVPAPLRRSHARRHRRGVPLCAVQNTEAAAAAVSTQTPKVSKRRKKPAPRAAPNARIVSNVSVGDRFVGTVCDVGPANSTWLEIGVATSTGKSVRARLPHVDSQHRKDTVGDTMPVYVHKIQPASARIEVRRGLFPPSKTQVPVDKRMLQSLHPAEELTGDVLALGAYGAVVDANVYREGRHGRLVPNTGLLPRKYFRKGWASAADLVIPDNAETIVRVGDELSVWVRAAQPLSARLLFDANPVTLQELEEERKKKVRRFRKKARRPSQATLQLHQERHGCVRELAKFGAFVDIGVKTDGLIHYSAMGVKHRGDWKEVLEVGTEVVVEVLTVVKDRVGLKLLAIVGEDDEEIVATATCATARIEDVDRLQMLQSRGKSRYRSATEAPSSKLNRKSTFTNANGVHRPKNDGLEMESKTGSTASAKEGDTEEGIDVAKEIEEKEEEEEIEKFSDEYFEEKYGY